MIILLFSFLQITLFPTLCFHLRPISVRPFFKKVSCHPHHFLSHLIMRDSIFQSLTPSSSLWKRHDYINGVFFGLFFLPKHSWNKSLLLTRRTSLPFVFVSTFLFHFFPLKFFFILIFNYIAFLLQWMRRNIQEKQTIRLKLNHFSSSSWMLWPFSSNDPLFWKPILSTLEGFSPSIKYFSPAWFLGLFCFWPLSLTLLILFSHFLLIWNNSDITFMD